jgi:hypothetical protein
MWRAGNEAPQVAFDADDFEVVPELFPKQLREARVAVRNGFYPLAELLRPAARCEVLRGGEDVRRVERLGHAASSS